jgi:hypothetical protein
MKLTAAIAAVLIFAATAAAGVNPVASKKYMTAAIRALGYPKPHPKTLACKGLGQGVDGSYSTFRCTATYRGSRRRFVTQTKQVGGWLCAGKTLAGCKLLKRGFVAMPHTTDSNVFAGTASMAARGWMGNHYPIPLPNPNRQCPEAGGSGMKWTSCWYVSDTSYAAVTITLKGAKGGYLISATSTVKPTG